METLCCTQQPQGEQIVLATLRRVGPHLRQITTQFLEEGSVTVIAELLRCYHQIGEDGNRAPTCPQVPVLEKTESHRNSKKGGKRAFGKGSMQAGHSAGKRESQHTSRVLIKLGERFNGSMVFF